MINNMTMLWFSLIFLFLVFEMGHPGLLYFLSFSCGASAAFIINLLEYNLQMQAVAFLAATCGAIALFQLFCGKHKLPAVSHRSNNDALLGKKVVVFRSTVNPDIWQTQIVGQVWQVRAIHDRALQDGQQVTIVDVQGCHLRVDIL